jgi:hypothetical protein
MDFQEALRARLLEPAHAAGRIHWVDRPQASTLPAITLQTVTDGRPQTMDGFQGSRPTTVQIDIWGNTYAEVKGITESVIATLAPAEVSNGIKFSRGFFTAVRDLGEQGDTKFIHRASVDFTVWQATE